MVFFEDVIKYNFNPSKKTNSMQFLKHLATAFEQHWTAEAGLQVQQPRAWQERYMRQLDTSAVEISRLRKELCTLPPKEIDLDFWNLASKIVAVNVGKGFEVYRCDGPMLSDDDRVEAYGVYAVKFDAKGAITECDISSDTTTHIMRLFHPAFECLLEPYKKLVWRLEETITLSNRATNLQWSQERKAAIFAQFMAVAAERDAELTRVMPELYAVIHSYER